MYNNNHELNELNELFYAQISINNELNELAAASFREIR